MYNLKIKKKYIGFILCCIGIFGIPYILRNSIMPQFASYNIVFYLGLVWLYLKNVIKLPSNKKVITRLSYAGIIILLSGLLFYVKGNGYNNEVKFKIFLVNILPSVMICTRINKDDDKRNIIKIWYWFLKICCYFMIIFFIMDIFIDNVIQKTWVNLYSNSITTYKYFMQGRFVSYFGNPLTNSNIMLMFLLWTFIQKQENIRIKNYILNIIVAVIGLAITGSKSGLIIGLFIVVAFLTDRKNYKYIIPIIFIIILAYYMGFFNVTISRILEGMEAGDMSTSRNTALERLMNDGTISFEFTKGHIIDYRSTSMIAALEYPVLRWAFSYGIIFSILMSVVYFVYPILSIIKYKKIRILLGVIAYIIFVNGCNDITTFGDPMIIYALNIMLLLSILNPNKSINRKELF